MYTIRLDCFYLVNQVGFWYFFLFNIKHIKRKENFGISIENEKQQQNLLHTNEK